MQFQATLVFTISLTLIVSQSATFAANKSHSHHGKVHSHTLPKTGIKHFHKHVHNGRAHVHPYSTKVGFKHTHKRKSSRAKAWEKAIRHNHAGKSHIHPLPRTGKKHFHRHKHGGRSHIHPLPISGNKHFHRVNNNSAKPVTKKPVTKSVVLNRQIAMVLNTPLKAIPKAKTFTNKPLASKQQQQRPVKKINLWDKKYQALLRTSPAKPTLLKKQPVKTSILNQASLKKGSGVHQHDGRSHQHALPTKGARHFHKHAHAGRLHSHPTPIAKTPHSHSKLSVKMLAKIPTRATVKATHPNNKQVAISKKPRRTIVNAQIPIQQKSKLSPKQIAEGNRQFMLALRYENGTGLKKNLPQAIKWYQRAARNGNSRAQFNLASIYAGGDGVKRNIQQALHWYKTAAINGDVNAQINLGNLYARGISITKNINEAAKWYKKAADQGDMRGRANLNYLVEDNNRVIRR